MKTCSQCNIEKDVTLFFKSSNTKDGLHSWCKECCTIGNKKSRQKRDSKIETRARVFLQNAKKSSIKRNNEFDITVDDVVECWNKQYQICAYSGIEMTLEAGKLNTVSIERIDSNIGYTKDNTILVCQAINRMKSNFNYDDFYKLCASVAKFLGDKELNLSVGAYK